MCNENTICMRFVLMYIFLSINLMHGNQNFQTEILNKNSMNLNN